MTEPGQTVLPAWGGEAGSAGKPGAVDHDQVEARTRPSAEPELRTPGEGIYRAPDGSSRENRGHDGLQDLASIIIEMADLLRTACVAPHQVAIDDVRAVLERFDRWRTAGQPIPGTDDAT